jgi:vitamin B12 transporter
VDQVSGISTAKLGTAVTVVTGEDLRRQQIRHAADALRSLPGVSVSRASSAASVTQIRIRGAEANHTLVLIDGIEANTGSNGMFDFSDLMAEDIERIEIIRGPQSALYGSNAAGGVINVVTKKGGGPLSVTARAEGGSFGTKGGAVRVSGGNKRIWGAATVQHQRSDGFNIAPEGSLGEKDGYRITSLSASAGAMLAENVRLDLNIRRSDKHFERDDATGLDRREGWDIASDSISHTSSTVLLMGASLRWDMLGGDLTHLFKATRNLTSWNDTQIADFDGNGFGPPLLTETNDDAYKFSYQASYRFATPGVRHAITGQVDHGRESFENQTKVSRNQTGLAAEWRGDIFERIYLSAGVRHDDNDAFEDFTTWRTGISIPVPELGIRPHASAGTGVRAPNMIELFGFFPSFKPNPDLTPEKAEGWDAGVEFTLLKGKAVVDVTYFDSDLTDKITTDPDTRSLINLPGRSKRRGVEVDAKFQVFSDLSVGLAYTYLDSVDSTGTREARRPPHAARGDVTYNFHDGRGALRFSAAYNGEFYDDVFAFDGEVFVNDRLILDDYWLVSAAASYKLNPGVEIYGRVENLFDEDYEEVFGFETAGIAAYAGLKWTFDYERLGDGLSLK